MSKKGTHPHINRKFSMAGLGNPTIIPNHSRIQPISVPVLQQHQLMPTIWPAPAPELCLPERSAPKSGSDKKARLRQKKTGYGYINHNTVHERLQLHFYLVFLNEIVEKSFVCIFLPSLSLNAKKTKWWIFTRQRAIYFLRYKFLHPSDQCCGSGSETFSWIRNYLFWIRIQLHWKSS